MKKYQVVGCWSLIVSIGLGSCSTEPKAYTSGITLVSQIEEGPVSQEVPSDFQAYWYQGKAELTSYELDQVRYGEIHTGHAVLIFVTEDFSEEKQVKLDYPTRAGKDQVKVMKCNFTKKFLTGIYPYSMMTSTFSPIDISENPHALKVTSSSQEWCGHTYTQLNAEKNHYRMTGYSYFESEGDESKKLQKIWLEDELWNYIRLAPESLPKGNIVMIPGALFSRLKHLPLKEEQAQATLKKAEGEPGMMEYLLSYPKLNRELRIRFQEGFPHEIEGWSERSEEFGRALVTEARLKKRIMTDYWTKHGKEDLGMRAELGL